MKLYGIKRWVVFISIICAFIGTAIVHAESQKGEKDMTVVSGKEISIEYTLKLEDKSVVDSNVGSDPLKFVQGDHKIIKGLENALEGMKIGESKEVTIKPEEAYGPIQEEAFIEVTKDQVPADALKVGAQLQGRNANGQMFFALVTEIKEEVVMLDCNHPLAGKTLYFDVKVLDVKENIVTEVPEEKETPVEKETTEKK